MTRLVFAPARAARIRVGRPAARFAAMAATTALLILFGCTEDSPASTDRGFCGAAETASCKEPTECDTAVVAGCAALDAALSPTTLVAAKDCLESKVCGVVSCISRAQTSARPTPEHATLAANYCAFCAPDVPDCETQFYAKKSKLPGGLVLPFSGAVAAAVDAECTVDQDVCRARFASCASETIARVVGEMLDPTLADCVVSAFRREGGSTTGPGGGPVITTCTRDNCDGCCRDDKCEKGDTESACGSGAAACQICYGAQRCKDGVCKEPCGPNNCAGCCDGDTCRSGEETGACGADGVACKSCQQQGSTFICSNKKCIDGSCKATCASGCCTGETCQPGTAANACGRGGEGCIDCGFGRLCDANTRSCTIDPNALWDFYVSFAVLPEKDVSGASWDTLGGAPDPYLIAYSSEGSSMHTGETQVQQDTMFPFWAETVLVGVKASELFNFTAFDVWDSDVDYDDLIGGCQLPLKPEHFDGSLLDYTCPATPRTGSVKLYYRIRPHRP